MTLATRLDISLSQQTLSLLEDGDIKLSYPISSALNGPGERLNSFCTPRGLHYIRAKIGASLPVGAVFVGRRFTGELYSEALAEAYPDRDWILSRILWLCGKEPGVNRFGQVDSQRRFIYIHGTPDAEPMGQPASHGCIRMRNQDVMALFEHVEAGTEVMIHE